MESKILSAKYNSGDTPLPENDTMDPIIVDDCQILGTVFGVFRFYK